MILDWDESPASVADRIESVHSPMKVLLKFKNDAIFIKEWVAHHERIVGRENLIIADNGSDMPEVVDYLNEVSDSCVVFRFKRHFNDIHRRGAFKKLYAALSNSCEFYIVSDTDERLAWLEGDTWSADHRLIEKVREYQPFSLMPALFLNNKPRSLEDFEVPQDTKLDGPPKWGKPIVDSKTIFPKEFAARLHNVQFPIEYFFSDQDFRVVNLHLQNYSPSQRLAVNHAKMVTHSLIDAGTSYEEIAAIDLNDPTLGPSMRRWVHEVRIALRNKSIDPEVQKTKRCVTFAPSGQLQFSEDGARDSFHEMIRQAPALLMDAIRSQINAKAASS